MHSVFARGIHGFRRATLFCVAATAVWGGAATAHAETAPWGPFSTELLGSRQYAVGVVEIALMTGMNPLGNFGAGIHYAERGSLLAQMLMGAASGAGAGAQAQLTGQDQTYYIDTSPRSGAGLEFDALMAKDGASILFDLFYGIPLGDDNNPIVLDFGSSFGTCPTSVVKSKATATEPATYKTNAMFGFVVGLLGPMTRWAQWEAALRLDITEPYWSAELGAVGNIGNRYFVRARVHYMEEATTFLMAGVRL
ncbi:MAG: hypothetical protein ACOYOB_07640 [Myxococcota bacterium]